MVEKKGLNLRTTIEETLPASIKISSFYWDCVRQISSAQIEEENPAPDEHAKLLFRLAHEVPIQI